MLGAVELWAVELEAAELGAVEELGSALLKEAAELAEELEAIELEAVELAVELALELVELTALELNELLLAELLELALLELEPPTLPPCAETACLNASMAVLASLPGHLEFKQLSIAPPFFSPLQTTWFIESQLESLLTAATQANKHAGGVAKTALEKRAKEATADATVVVRITN